MLSIERVTKAIIAELHRQAEISGCATEENGVHVHVDGSFEIEPLVRAALKVI